MRVLCIGNRYPPWSVGGYESIWQGFVCDAESRGDAVRILTTVPDPTDRPGVPGGDVQRELRWYWRAHAFPEIGTRACVELERANARTLRRHLHEFAPDVVMWWSMGGMSLSLLEQTRRAGLPALGMVCDDWMQYGPQVDGWTRRWRRIGPTLGSLYERLAGVPARLDLDGAARWVFISDYTRRTARDCGLELPNSMVEHAGIDPERFAPSERRPWAWRLLYCGRVEPRKGVATAVRALARLPASATLTVKGDGPAAFVAELGALAASFGIADRLRFEPSSPPAELRDAYASCDALLFPVTWREPWGLVPLEAMAVGRPVVATRAGGGAAEYLVDGANCLQFDPDDDAGLADAVQRLAADPALRESLCQGGRRTAARFTDRRLHAALERELGALARRT